MSELSLKENAQMLTSSLVWGGAKTFEQLKELDWLKNISEYGILMYIREAERRGWIRTKITEGKPNLYISTVKGRRMADTRD
jgi:hypothetical protein|uniref:Uncharacterized protein n=1 Tax=Siphoviridae sp. cttma3 TaxID=2825708 RepID=A0A8S5V8Q9_9CAUD|nr:MAG TPA: hypothetical protein [Siphoviridae sp. cttma3]